MALDRKIAIDDLKNRSKRKIKFNEISTIVDISEFCVYEAKASHLNELVKRQCCNSYDNISTSVAYSKLFELIDIDQLVIIPINYNQYPSFKISLEKLIKHIDYVFFALDDDLHICDEFGNLLLSVIGDREEFYFLEFTIYLPKSFP